jgi:hypothetical protein
LAAVEAADVAAAASDVAKAVAAAVAD